MLGNFSKNTPKLNNIEPIKYKNNKKIANITTKIKQFITNNIEELCIFGGCFFVLYATFLINYIAFLYVMGAMLFSLGVFLLKFPSKK